MIQGNLAGVARKLFEKLDSTDFFRNFGAGNASAKDGFHTLRTKVIEITLPFDSRKSRTFTRISHRQVSEIHIHKWAWATPAFLLIRAMREPTWAKEQKGVHALLYR